MDSKVIEIHDSNYEQETNTGVTVVDFRADWCPPCKMMDPILKKLSTDEVLGSKVKFTSMNVDNDPQTAGALGVQGIPTFLIKKDGKIVSTMVGARPKDAFRAEIEKHLD
ncbi:thioredoxin family protein [Companilactobacillus mishanensis]|uniref:Thioredoxin n=1 Tax=Companilactobacillus mishanensis TaxID=2486008 RepID=A0A5P0ZHK9_9LACO|nr:thioredoxin family protein [Companilactobacillus mishanensis]MQS45475.1 thioredoxin family protein [Companilactobacillus mishanensis]MQS52541.1 thioredoxin family protein [Companilactobacillus mishanensis]MQS89199.1 thioredoxin family protein [Companilactobacillus mishanensis]